MNTIQAKATALRWLLYPTMAAIALAALFAAPSAHAQVSATKTVELHIDRDADGEVDRGDVLRHTVEIETLSDADMAVFREWLDANLDLVPGSIKTTPLAMPDSYAAFTNFQLVVNAADGLLANDKDLENLFKDPDPLPLNTGLVVTSTGVFATVQNGTMTIDADGSFVYDPPPVGTTDTFTYTIEDPDGNTDIGVVTITVAGDTIHFVNNTASPGGNGTMASPYNTLAAAEAAADEDDIIFVYRGDGTSTGLNTGITLKNGQRLIGEGTGLFIGGQEIVSAGNSPMLANATDVISLANNNTIRGLNITAAGGAGIAGSGVQNATVSDIEITVSNANTAIDLTNAAGIVNLATMTLSGTGQALTLSGGNASVSMTASTISTGSVRLFDISNKSGGSVNLSSATVTSTNHRGYSITGSSAGVVYTMPSISIASGTPSDVNAIHLNNNSTASITLGEFSVNTSNAVGFFTNNGGNVNFSSSNNSVNSTGSAAIDITTTSITNGAFQSASSSNSAGKGINLNGVSGALTISSGSISGAGGIAFHVTGGSGNVTSGLNITNNANRSVQIESRTGGTVALNGTVNDTGLGLLVQNNTGGTITFTGSTKSFNTGTNAGVSLTSNTGAAINFTGGGLAVSTTSGAAFTATGGGTVSVLGIGNTLSTTTATALNVANTTIGAGNLNFRSISSSGGSSTGIILSQTGSSGGLVVTGTGSAGSGGTIQNKTGADGLTTDGIGIYLNSTSNVSLSRMQLNDFSNFAILGEFVGGFSLSNSTINGSNGNNAAEDEGSVYFSNLTGSANISNTLIQGGLEDNFNLENTSGTLNRLTFDNVTIGPNSTDDGNDGISIEANGSAVVNVTVQNSTFTSARGDLFQYSQNNNGLSDLVFTGNTLTNNHPGIATGGGGVTITGANFTFDISNNTFRDAVGTAVLIVKTIGAGTLSGTFANNQVGVAATTNSGSLEGSGLIVRHAGQDNLTIAITGNQIYQYNNYGIDVQAGAGLVQGGNLNATITGNTVGSPGNNPAFDGGLFRGIHLNSGVTPEDSFQVCFDLGGAGGLANNILNSSRNGLEDFRLRQRQSTTVRLPGYGGSATDTNAVVAFIQGRNTGTPSGSAVVNSPPGGGFVGGAACTLP